MPADPTIVLSIVAPLKNDGDILADFLDEVVRVVREKYAHYEIILVDDASTDTTSEVVTDLLKRVERVRYLRFSRAFGRDTAISAGLETSIGDFVVCLVPNDDPVELIPDMVARCRAGKGLVYGVSRKPRRRGFLTAQAVRVFHEYCRRSIGVVLHPNSTDFRAFSRQVVNALIQIKEKRRYLRVFAAGVGYSQESFEYDPICRGGNRHESSLMDQFNQAVEIMVGNSPHPLRLVSRLGFLASCLNALYILYIVLVYLLKRDVAPGWTTLSMQNTVMFLFLFLILAVLCEYVGNILEEVRPRPLYFVSEEKNSPVLLENTIRKNIFNESTGGGPA